MKHLIYLLALFILGPCNAMDTNNKSEFFRYKTNLRGTVCQVLATRSGDLCMDQEGFNHGRVTLMSKLKEQKVEPFSQDLPRQRKTITFKDLKKQHAQEVNLDVVYAIAEEVTIELHTLEEKRYAEFKEFSDTNPFKSLVPNRAENNSNPVQK